MLARARQIGLEEGLRYVYEGNVPGSEGEHTYCYSCKRIVVKRYGYTIVEYNIQNSSCIYCGAIIDGIGL
jgi:pyruvate formate lyase activating enzyme